MEKLEPLTQKFSVCLVPSGSTPESGEGICFWARTDEEVSCVCETERVPDGVLAREDGWRALRVAGVLDFSLIGVLAGLTRALADAGIGVFVVSTFRTDYLLVKEERFDSALAALRRAGYACASDRA